MMPSEQLKHGTHERALTSLECFLGNLLPYHVRHSRRWRHAGPELRRQLTEDLRQELTLDCLQRATQLETLEPRERHRQWFRLTDRWLYIERSRSRPLPPEAHSQAAPTRSGYADAVEHESLELTEAARQPLLGEGPARGKTWNITRLASIAGTSRRKARTAWTELLERVGYDKDYFAFWQKRLAEALTGLAADLLLDAGQLSTVHRARRTPDPVGRRGRVRRILRMLAVAPAQPDLLRTLAECRLRRQIRSVTPVTLLTAAEQLDAHTPAIPLWSFEACLLDGNLLAAARALRRARQKSADRVACTLARARLIAAQGKIDVALRALRRAQDRQPEDPRLREALCRSTSPAAADHRSANARSNAAPSSSSSRASGRADDHVGVEANNPKPR